MNTRELKSALYREISAVTKAMGNPHRLEILDLIAQGPVSVEYISKHTNLPLANASQHLQVLRTSNLVRVDRRGKFLFYELANEHVFEVWKAMRTLGFSQNEEVGRLIDDYRGEREDLQIISAEELRTKLESQEVIVLDVRPEEEFRLGHLHGAVSVPKDQVLEYLKDVPRNIEIVAYCRGPLCMMADSVVQTLNRNGYKAWRLDVGVPEFTEHGLELLSEPV
jgi:DNA-binding transcriptional ArsR family regulator